MSGARRKLAIAGFAAFALLAAGTVLPVVAIGTRTRISCALCRTERVDRTLFGIPWQTHRDNEFARWYRANRPPHEHLWGRESCTLGYSVFGTAAYFACGRRHPICDVPREFLLEYCQQADEATLAAFFEGVASQDREVQKQTVQTVLDALDPVTGSVRQGNSNPVPQAEVR